MEETSLNTLEWTGPEYNHKERTNDFFWTIGLITAVACIVTLWFSNYVFAVFILISGACLIMFTIRSPKEVSFAIKSEGLFLGKDKYEWKNIKGFNIKKGEPYYKLIVQTSKAFLPVYTIPIPLSLADEARETLLKVIPNIDINESGSMVFAEKIGL